MRATPDLWVQRLDLKKLAGDWRSAMVTFQIRHLCGEMNILCTALHRSAPASQPVEQVRFKWWQLNSVYYTVQDTCTLRCVPWIRTVCLCDNRLWTCADMRTLSVPVSSSVCLWGVWSVFWMKTEKDDTDVIMRTSPCGSKRRRKKKALVFANRSVIRKQTAVHMVCSLYICK